jgi:hypothetical protein
MEQATLRRRNTGKTDPRQTLGLILWDDGIASHQRGSMQPTPAIPLAKRYFCSQDNTERASFLDSEISSVTLVSTWYMRGAT